MKKIFIVLAATLFFALIFFQRGAIKNFFVNLNKADVPIPVAFEEINKEIAARPETTTLPGVIKKPQPAPDTSPAAPKPFLNLAVPFQAQAPFADWSEPYGNACEEASFIMVDYYLRGKTISKQEMKDEIDAMISLQASHGGNNYDLSVAEVKILAAEAYPSYSFEIIENLTIEKIKAELQKGRPLIIPAAGRELGNPNYRFPGPIYHMLVIKGYTADGRFITNDPGTRNGADYIYEAAVIMKSIRDWDGIGPNGPSRGLVMYK